MAIKCLVCHNAEYRMVYDANTLRYHLNFWHLSTIPEDEISICENCLDKIMESEEVLNYLYKKLK